MALAQILLRGGTSAEWAAANPVLAARELAVDTTSKRVKVGDGQNAWSALPWVTMDAAEVARLEAAATALDDAATPYDAATATVLGQANSASRKVLSDTIGAGISSDAADANGAIPAAIRSSTYLKDTFATPRGNRVVFLGDSTLQGNAADPGVGSYTTKRYANSWPVFCATISNQRIQIAKHAGIWGNTTQQMIDRFEKDVTAHTPDAVVILTGRNDPSATVTLAGVQTLIAKVRAIGALPVLCIPLPTNTTDHKQRMATTATKLRGWARKNRVSVIDFYGQFTEVDGSLKASLGATDGIHPSIAGHKAMADFAAPILSALLPEAPRVTAIGDSDTDNLLQQPLFRGTAANGVVAPWSRTPLAWATYNIVGVPGWAGMAQQVEAVAGDGTGTDAQVRQNIAIGASTINVGDMLEFTGRVKVVANLPDSRFVFTRLMFEGPGEVIGALETNVSVDGTFRITYVVPPGTTSIRAMLLIQAIASGSATVQWGELAVRNLTKLGIA